MKGQGLLPGRFVGTPVDDDRSTGVGDIHPWRLCFRPFKPLADIFLLGCQTFAGRLIPHGIAGDQFLFLKHRIQYIAAHLIDRILGVSVPPGEIEFMIEFRRQLTVCFGHRPRTAVQQNDGKGAHNVAAAIFLIFNIRFPSGLLLRRSRQDQATPNKRNI